MELARYKACICEGSAERAIMDILLDNDLLILHNIRDMFFLYAETFVTDISLTDKGNHFVENAAAFIN